MLLKLLHVLFVAICFVAGFGYCFHRFNKIVQHRTLAFSIAKWMSLAMSLLVVLVLFLRLLNLNRYFLPFQLIAYLWMIFVFYLFAIIIFVDVALFLLSFFKSLKKRINCRIPKIRHIVFFAAIFVSISIVTYGIFHFAKPEVKYLTIETQKIAPSCKMVVVSDLHLGTMSVDLFKKNVKKLNALHPDVVLLLGDQFVVNRQDAVSMGYADVFKQINAPLGVFAINGNHEYFHGYLNKEDVGLSDFYRNIGITMLQDTTLTIENQFVLVGRLDSSRISSRKSLPQLMQDVPTDIPIVLMDHEPNGLNASKSCGVDLHLSGHTHHGQIFPMNWVQDIKSLLSGKLKYGYRKDGQTQYFVTAGLGGSGAPLRIGTTGEILVVQWKQKAQ